MCALRQDSFAGKMLPAFVLRTWPVVRVWGVREAIRFAIVIPDVVPGEHVLKLSVAKWTRSNGGSCPIDRGSPPAHDARTPSALPASRGARAMTKAEWERPPGSGRKQVSHQRLARNNECSSEHHPMGWYGKRRSIGYPAVYLGTAHLRAARASRGQHPLVRAGGAHSYPASSPRASREFRPQASIHGAR